MYVRSAVEALPAELSGVADHVTAILPWGSLLAALVRPLVPVLRSVRGLCQSQARLTVVFALDPRRDQAESRRLGLPTLAPEHFQTTLSAGYRAAGFELKRVWVLGGETLRAWPSSWARRLAFGTGRSFYQIDAVAAYEAGVTGPR